MNEVIKEIDSSAVCIYAAGGSGMFEVDSEKADRCIKTIERLYLEKTLTSSITGVAISKNDDVNFSDLFKKLSCRLRMAKDAKLLNYSLVTHPFLRTCDSCGEEYARYRVEEGKLICKSCKNKRDKDQQIKRNIEEKIKIILSKQEQSLKTSELWERLLFDLFQSQRYDIKDRNRPEDFEKLAKLSLPSGYIGLLYADGNGMGTKLQELRSEDEANKFSNIVDQGIYRSTLEAITKNLQPHPENDFFPFDILLLGGDDLVMVTVAHKAIETATTIVDSFRKYTSSRWKEPLNLSLGVAIAHAKFPFGNLLNMAENLLKFAKKEGVKREQQHSDPDNKHGLINFQVVSASNSLNFSEDYKKVFVYEEEKPPRKSVKYIRTLRPYDSQTMEILLEKIRAMKSFPKNKIQALREAVFLDYGNSLLQGLAIHSRLKNDQKELIKEVLSKFSSSNTIDPILWFEKNGDFYTPFLDIAELYDFIQ